MNSETPLDPQNDQSLEVPPQPVPTITTELAILIRNAHGIADILPIVMNALGTTRADASKRYVAFLEEEGSLQNEDNGVKHYQVHLKHYPRLLHLSRKYESNRLGFRVIPQIFIVSLVAMFDAFLGRLIRCLFYIKPEILNASNEKLSFSQLVAFGSLDEAKEHIIEQEIDEVLRASHADQFKWLEERFSISLRKDLPSWPTFIEITERRNLFVHTGGVVTEQYLSVCRKHGVDLQMDLKLGEELQVSPEYFNTAYMCVLEIAIKLTQVLWRKISPEALEAADKSLIETTFDLLVLGEYDLATILLQFAYTILKKFSSDQTRRIFIINLAQAHKWSGRQQECQQVLNGEDWSSTSDKFALGVAVLKDDFQLAVKIMRRIGSEGEVEEHDYKTWPLFQEFRKSPEFANAFQDIFGYPLTTTAESPDLAELDHKGA
jgi:hypothetical protein